MNILITILAREKNQGLPNKHILPFVGSTLLDKALSYAERIVESDDKDNIDAAVFANEKMIEKVKLNYKNSNFHWISRPQSFEGEKMPKLKAINFVKSSMEMSSKKKYDVVIDLDATAPLRKVRDFFNILRIYENWSMVKPIDAILTAVESRRNPYFNIVEYGGFNVFPSKRYDAWTRQSVPKTYDLVGSIYSFSGIWIDDRPNSVFDGNICLSILEPWQGYDVDTHADFEIVEFLFKKHAKELGYD